MQGKCNQDGSPVFWDSLFTMPNKGPELRWEKRETLPRFRPYIGQGKEGILEQDYQDGRYKFGLSVKC